MTPLPTAKKVSDNWQRKFTLIEKAGGPKMPNARALKFGERNKIVFNIWAFLFGPFYYLAKGMWRKAITLSAICVIGVVVVGLILDAMNISSGFLGFVGPAVFSVRANVDFYKKVMLGQNGWW